jgi:hypothetical protein
MKVELCIPKKEKERFEMQIDKEEKEKWEKVAKELKISLAQLIRNGVYRLIVDLKKNQ